MKPRRKYSPIRRMLAKRQVEHLAHMEGSMRICMYACTHARCLLRGSLTDHWRTTVSLWHFALILPTDPAAAFACFEFNRSVYVFFSALSPCVMSALLHATRNIDIADRYAAEGRNKNKLRITSY